VSEDSNWTGSANVGFHDRFTLGAYHGGGTHHYLAGCLDEVKIYDRSLSGEEVLWLGQEARPAITSGQNSKGLSESLEMSLQIITRISSTSFVVNQKDGDQVYWFRAQEASNKVNGEWINSWAQLTEETKSYTSGTGRKRALRVLQEVDSPKEVERVEDAEEEVEIEEDEDAVVKRTLYGQDQFIKELKSGREWKVLISDPCPLCKGSGQVNSVGGKRRCSGCYVYGSFSWNLVSGKMYTIVTVRW
tara:strand:- start:384 stop:1121 length:738 start_codon:yes stop_codon:yes gene_type:complete